MFPKLKYWPLLCNAENAEKNRWVSMKSTRKRDLRQVSVPGRSFRAKRVSDWRSQGSYSWGVGVELMPVPLIPKGFKWSERRLHLTVVTGSGWGVKRNWVCIPSLHPACSVTLYNCFTSLCLYFLTCKEIPHLKEIITEYMLTCLGYYYEYYYYFLPLWT